MPRPTESIPNRKYPAIEYVRARFPPVTPESERFELLGFRVTYLHSSDGFALLQWDAPPRASGIPIHYHDATEEGFYVLAGQIGLLIDQDELVRDAGGYTVVQPGQHHTFWNPTDEEASYLTPIVPGGFAEYLRELAAGLERTSSDEDETSLRKRLGEKYDVTVVGPPPYR
jgi:quercetin dioxygenase-like cupin family protein